MSESASADYLSMVSMHPVRTLKAVNFSRFMDTGKTAPVLCGCEDAHGAYAGEFVVKLAGNIDMGRAGLSFELAGSLLAAALDIQTPVPAIVNVDAQILEMMANAQPVRAASILKSAGLNFGSTMLTNATTWPVDKHVPDEMLSQALNIFCFDAVVQNPDRRFDKPNLLQRDSDFFVIDHELAFSFLLPILGGRHRQPWELNEHEYLDKHLFSRELKRHFKRAPLDFSHFGTNLTTLTDQVLVDILTAIPEQWIGDNMDGIKSHLQSIRDNAGAFLQAIQWRLG